MNYDDLKYLSCTVLDGGGLVNTLQGAIEKNAHGQEDYLISILDLLSVAESIVLNDKILLTDSTLGYGNMHKGPDGHKDEEPEWNDSIKPLVNEGIVFPVPIKTQKSIAQPPPSNRYDDYEFERHHRQEFKIHQDAWFQSSRVISVERDLLITATPMIRQRQVYEVEGNVQVHHSVTNFVSKYTDFSKSLMNYRYDESFLSEYGIVKIPPIALEVVKASKNREDILAKILEFRDKYSSLRSSLRQLRQDLKDPNLTPKEKQKLLRAWTKSWETLHKYNDLGSFVGVANTSTGLLEADKSKAEHASTVASMDFEGFLSGIARMGVEAYSSIRIRLLHNLASQFLSTSNHDLAISTQRLFDCELSRKEIQIIDRITSPEMRDKFRR